MAKLKLKTLPKKPKLSAGVSTMEKYFIRVKEIQKENARRMAENKKLDSLKDKVRTYKPTKTGCK